MTSIKTLATIAFLALAGVLAFVVAQNGSPDSDRSSTAVHRFADASEIPGTSSQLIRSNGVVAMELNTYELRPGAPYTVWWVVFNSPLGCSGECGEDDIFAADGTMSLNPDANISILFADGAVADAEGNASFSALLEENRASGEVLAGPGLTDAAAAEIHLVVRDHGDLQLADSYAQLTTFQPECSACADVQFTVHKPGYLLAGN